MNKLFVIISMTTIFISTQANAGFLFCRSKLEKVGMTNEESTNLCKSPANEQIKKILASEDAETVRKVLTLMYETKTYQMNRGIVQVIFNVSPDNALKIIKKVPEEALKNFSKVIIRFGENAAVRLATEVSPEKLKDAGVISSKYPGGISEFVTMLNEQTPETISDLASIIHRVSYKSALLILSKANESDIKCGLALSGATGNEQVVENNILLCSQYSAGNLCQAKEILISAFIKNPTSEATKKYLSEVVKSDFYSYNQAALLSKIINGKYLDDLSQVRDMIFSNAEISDDTAEQLLKELDNNRVNKDHLKEILKKGNISSYRQNAQPYVLTGSARAPWGNGSLPACNTSNAIIAVNNTKSLLAQACKEAFGEFEMLACNMSVKYSDNSLRCNFAVELKATYIPDTVKNCYENDLR